MAGTRFQVPFTDVALADGVFKSVAAVKAAANHPCKVTGLRLAADGISGDAKPLGFKLQRVTAGTGTGTSATPRKLNNGLSAVVQSTARVNFTAAPTDTAGEELYVDKFHPQGGIAQKMSFEECFIDGGTEIAVQIKTPAGETVVNVSGHLECEE